MPPADLEGDPSGISPPFTKGDNYWKECVLPSFEAHHTNPTLDTCAAILQLFGISAVVKEGEMTLTNMVWRRSTDRDWKNSKYETVSHTLDADASHNIVVSLTRAANLVHDAAGTNNPASLARLSGTLVFESVYANSLTEKLPVRGNGRDLRNSKTSGNRQAANTIRAHLKYFTEVGLARETANGFHRTSRVLQSYAGSETCYYRIKVVGEEGHERVRVVGCYADSDDGKFYEYLAQEIPVEYFAQRMINAKTCTSPVVEVGVGRLSGFEPPPEDQERGDIDYLEAGVAVLEEAFRGL